MFVDCVRCVGYTSSGPADSGVYVWDIETSQWSDTFHSIGTDPDSSEASQTDVPSAGSGTKSSSGEGKSSSVVGIGSNTATTRIGKYLFASLLSLSLTIAATFSLSALRRPYRAITLMIISCF